MTRRTSLVAVWRSSASARSRLRASSAENIRTFSIAMTAWLAKVWTSSICAAVKGFTRRRPQPMASYNFVEIAGPYWHFLDLVWIMEFTFMYLL